MLGLEDEQLLTWFNEFHAALLEADKQLKLAREAKDDARRKVTKTRLLGAIPTMNGGALRSSLTLASFRNKKTEEYRFSVQKIHRCVFS